MAEWNNATFPDGCRHCGTTSRRSLGRGLCSRCYQRQEIRNQYEPIRAVDSVMADDQTFVEDPMVIISDHNKTGDLGDFPMGEGLVDEVAPNTSEQRPGAPTSPLGEAEGDAVPPASGFRAWRGRFAGKFRADQSGPGEDPQPRPKRVRATTIGRRVSAADTLGDAWSGLGTMAIQSGHIPTGRMLQFQSQVAGEMLDEAVKGSILDRKVLQPIVRSRSRFDLISAVMGPPLLVLAMERDPSRAEVLLPVLRSQIRASLPLMLPAIKKVEEKNRKAAEAAAQLFPDLPPGEDPADAIIQMLFDGWAPPAPPVMVEPDPATTDQEVPL